MKVFLLLIIFTFYGCLTREVWIDNEYLMFNKLELSNEQCLVFDSRIGQDVKYSENEKTYYIRKNTVQKYVEIPMKVLITPLTITIDTVSTCVVGLVSDPRALAAVLQCAK